ncbi:MAG: NfeD family protein [Lachnospiraceae bacterium]|nr:NfeD family protein [Lachnospiraceae bacterium]
MQPIYWLFLMVILLVIEILTLGLTTIWFAGGALAAFAVGVFGPGLPVQLGVFVAVSVVLLVSTRPLAARYLNRNTQKTNVESLEGQTAVVTETIDNRLAQGMVQVNGVSWSARSSEDDAILETGALVRIEGVQGVKLIVSEQKEGLEK